MSEPFIGEIKMVGFNFAPRGYAQCNGQLMSIAQNTALFSLLGTMYGGDGRVTFGLPSLQGRCPIHQGSGSGLTPRVMGEMGGTENVTLNTSEMPAHVHSVSMAPACSIDDAETANPVGGYPAIPNSPGGAVNAFASSPTSGRLMGSTTTTSSVAGSSIPHPNMPPFLVVNFVIATQGIFPSRN